MELAEIIIHLRDINLPCSFHITSKFKITIWKISGIGYIVFLSGFTFVSIAFFLVFFSCGQSNTNEKNEITFWSSNNAHEIEFTAFHVDNWNISNAIKVDFQPVPEGQSSEEVILASVVGKTTPDIYANMWQGSVEMYAKAGVLIPFDTLQGFMEFINERCTQKTIEEITSSDGHIYQVPWKINPIMNIYNNKLLSEYGLPELPVHYSDYMKAGEIVTKDKDDDGYIDNWIGYTEVKVIWYQRLFNFYPLYLAASGGGSLIENNRAAFNNEYAIGVFTFLQDIYKKQYFSQERLSAGQDRFISEDILTKWTGPWEINHTERFKKREDFTFGFFPMQVPDEYSGPIFTYSDPKNIVIFNSCNKPNAAWKFIESLITRDGDLKLLEFTGQLPNRKNMQSDPFFQDFFDENPKLKVFAEQANYVRGVDNCEVIVEVFDIISQEYEACVIYNKKTPEKALEDAEKAVNNLLRAN